MKGYVITSSVMVSVTIFAEAALEWEFSAGLWTYMEGALGRIRDGDQGFDLSSHLQAVI